MADRRRLDNPKVNLESINSDLDQANLIALNHEDKKEREKALVALYAVNGREDMQNNLMQDIILSKMADAKTMPTARKTKTAIYNEYCKITGLGRASAELYFKKAQAGIKKFHNLGMVVHHAAAVANDTISRIHTDLDRLEEQEARILRDLEDTDDQTKEGRQTVANLDRSLQKIISLKNKSYERLLEYSKSFGIDLAIKSQQNTINQEKNEILAQKFDNDAQWQKADIAVKYKDMSPEEKRKMLIQTISSDKGITAEVESTFSAEVVDEE